MPTKYHLISPYFKRKLSGGAPANNATVQAWLNKIATDGYTAPTAPKIAIYNTAWDYADAQGLTSQFDLVGLLKVENQNLCKVPFIHSGGSARRFILQDSPTFTANAGLKSDGVGYLRTTWVPSTDAVNYLLNNAAYGASTPSSVQVDAGLMGCFTPDGYRLYPKYSDDNCYFQINSGDITVTPILPVTPLGLTSAVRVDGINQLAYKNGVSLGSQGANSTSVGSSEFTVLTEGVGQSVYTENVDFFFASSGSIDQVKLNTFVNLLLL